MSKIKDALGEVTFSKILEALTLLFKGLLDSLFISYVRPSHYTVDWASNKAKDARIYPPLSPGVPSGMHEGKPTYGDSMLFAGLLSTVEHRASLPMVRNAQGNNGRLFRSPWARRDIESGKGDEVDSFSRDQLLGYLSSVVPSAIGTYSFPKFLSYLKTNKFLLCPKSSDGRNELRPTTKALVYRVARATHNLNLIPRSWYFYTLVDRIGQLASVSFSKLGYRVHLAVVSSYVNQVVGNKNWIDRWIYSVAHRRDRANHFYEVLAHGVSYSLVQRLEISYARSKFFLANGAPPVPVSTSAKWMWERDFAQDPTTEALFWDWVFLFSLIKEIPSE